MTKTIRCFFAIHLPAELKTQIDKYIVELKNINPEVKWIKAQSLHITLKFLGNIEHSLAEQVSEAALNILKPGFKIRVSETGAFPNQSRPRIFWLGIQTLPHNPLHDLQKTIELTVKPLGFEKEKRQFNPHLTLGRVKVPADFRDLWNHIEAKPFEPIEFDIKEFFLMRSILRPVGAEYRIIKKYPLKEIDKE